VDREGGDPGAPRAPKIAGTRFGDYTLLCKLATGGMGELFVGRRAAAGGFEKLVVIKRLLPHLAEDAHFVAMLLDEARIAARLSHPNVCQVYDLGEAEGHYYITMEHLEGVPASLLLRRASRAGQRLELGLAAAILRQTAAGLHHAHELCDHEGNSLGLVHRDVSPSNLFVTADGVVKVLDFGVAKSQDALARTHTGALKGKYAYMSPEHVLGEPVDRRSDVWSLGIVLHELITAQRLFWRDSEYKMFQAIIDEPIPPLVERRPGVPARVAAVADRALTRDPRRRFASARDMGEALEAAMNGAGGIWTASRIADYVAEHFDELMRERRDEVQAGMAGALRRSRSIQASLAEAGLAGLDEGDRSAAEEGTVDVAPEDVDLGPDDQFDDDELEVDPGRPEATHILVGSRDRRTIPPPLLTPPSRRRTWLGGLAIAAALGGAGVFGYLEWFAPAPRAPTPVVVLGGEVETNDGRVTRRPPVARREAPARGDRAGPEGGSGPPPASEAAARDLARAGVGAGRGARAPSRERTGSDAYKAAVERHQAEFVSCFRQFARGVGGAPALSVAFDIEARGGVTGAQLVPAELESTPLGACILAVARRVDFARQAEPVRVTVPLLVRKH
jgi:serine/threonine-protein kinase